MHSLTGIPNFLQKRDKKSKRRWQIGVFACSTPLVVKVGPKFVSSQTGHLLFVVCIVGLTDWLRGDDCFC